MPTAARMARNRAYRHNADLILPELSLGMDVLKHLHLYLAFGEQALYLAPANAVPGATRPHLAGQTLTRCRRCGIGKMTIPTRDPQTILATLLDAAKRPAPMPPTPCLSKACPSSVSYRLGKLEDVERSESADLGLRVFVGKQVAFVSSTDFSADALAALPGRAIAMARLAPEDKFAGLAPKDRLAKPFPRSIWKTRPNPRRSAGRARPRRRRRRHGGARASPIPKAAAPPSRAAPWRWPPARLLRPLCRHQPFASASRCWRAKAPAWSATMTRPAPGMPATCATPEEIGRRAGEKAGQAAESPQGEIPERAGGVSIPREAAGLLGHFAGAISGAAIARGVSFLKDRMGAGDFRARHHHHRRSPPRARPALQAVRRRRRRQQPPRPDRKRQADQLAAGLRQRPAAGA